MYYEYQNNCFINYQERTTMNRNIYLSLALATCMGFASAPLFAEVTSVPAAPANITAPVTTPEEHHEAAALHKQHAEHHQALTAHHKSLAAEYKSRKTGSTETS
jgi:hypothetical protein